MSDKKLKLNIATPDRKFFSGEVDMIIVKTIAGEIGIMPNHLPLVSVLDIGTIEIKSGQEIKKGTVNMGFIQHRDNEVSIFTDSAEWPEEIDLDRAKDAKKRAEDRIASKSSEVDVARAELALKRAINRIKITE